MLDNRCPHCRSKLLPAVNFEIHEPRQTGTPPGPQVDDVLVLKIELLCDQCRRPLPPTCAWAERIRQQFPTTTDAQMAEQRRRLFVAMEGVMTWLTNVNAINPNVVINGIVEAMLANGADPVEMRGFESCCRTGAASVMTAHLNPLIPQERSRAT